ncbi:MAG: amino acid racemase, partial [Hyphomicrobiales bacterium]|nr:amino acid racemase [Hyphomicrobiales bacterium]
NEGVQARRGGYHSARLVLSSVDFAQYEAWMRHGEWHHLGAALANEADALRRAGAEAILLCTNTMHKAARDVTSRVDVPFIDIRDVTGRAIVKAGVKRPLLLGTRYTMADDFFVAHLSGEFGLEPMVPGSADQDRIHAVIFDELVKGKINPDSRAVYQAIIAAAQGEGADGIIFGCTEIGMLIGAGDVTAPIFDTMQLHVDAALEFALSPLHLL